MKHELSPFQPDWASPPGETISRVIAQRGVSLEGLAKGLDISVHHAHGLIEGTTKIDDALAKRLADFLGATRKFWLAREMNYRSDVEHIRSISGDEDTAKRLWYRQLPARDMAKFGWVELRGDPIEKADAMLKFFGVQSVASWQAKYSAELKVAAFRKSLNVKSNPAAIAAWLRWAEIKSAAIECQPWDSSKFRKRLNAIRSLTRRKHPTDFLPILRQICADCGIALVIAPAPNGCPVSGATRFVSTNKALIVLSFRYRSDDHFWFTFFHEAGHLLLHNKRALFLEGESEVSSAEEDEANSFAERILIPSDAVSEMLNLGSRSREIIRFALRIGVSAGVVVGQLQHRGILKHNQFNSLKRRYVWKDLGEDILATK